ncbi:STM4015 family protein [Micromonospora sp. DH15]|nr:STM4015 family protein [Micromonospora sp. DH15]
MIRSHLSSFAGLPVLPFTPGMKLPDDPSAVAWRLEVEDFEAEPEEFAALVTALRDEVPAAAVRAVVIGEWGSAYERALPVELLIDAAQRWTSLRAVFLADLVSEQCEISWLTHGDVTGLLTAYPSLEVLWVRGGEDFRFSPVRHGRLRRLEVESGGLSGDFVRAVLDSELPALTDLELWLGVEYYGGDTTVDDLAPLLAGQRFPALRRLGLCNAEHADEIAEALAAAPVVRRLELLDLSLGTLSDRGALALAGGQPLTHLTKLDLSHHYVSDEVVAAVRAAVPGVTVDLSDPQEPDIDDDEEHRYTAVSE